MKTCNICNKKVRLGRNAIFDDNDKIVCDVCAGVVRNPNDTIYSIGGIVSVYVTIEEAERMVAAGEVIQS